MSKIKSSLVFFQLQCTGKLGYPVNIKGMLILLLLFRTYLPTTTAQTIFSAVAEVPDPKAAGLGYVSDPDGILGDTFVQLINERIARLEDSATVQFAVVVLPSIGEENPKDFATRLFNHWGIGQADKDNGLLILTVMDQRRTEFETGYGLEGVLPDALCYRLGMQYLVPYFKDDAYGQGILEVVNQFGNILENPEALEEVYSDAKSGTKNKGNAGGIIFYIYLFINLIFHGFVLFWIATQLNSKQDAYLKYQAIRKVYSVVPVIFFPVPYGLVMLFLKKQLHQLRNMKRYSKTTGNLLVKLSEADENTYLQKGQITEEELGAVDYDVWVAENDPDDILILRYEKRWSSWQKCPDCGYKTYHLAHSKVLRSATTHSSGEKVLTYSCENCHYCHEKTVIIPKLSSGGSGGGGSSGGSSSWGGGSSGGGGAGVSW